MSQTSQTNSRARWIAPLLVLILGAIAYCNSENGPFIFDDMVAIVKNPQIRTLNPFHTRAPGPSTTAGRPVLIFSFAANYAIAELHVQIYHLTNLLIHLLCALLLYAIVRQTLLRKQVWGDRFAGAETWLAAAAAGLWVVHPLNTQAVTYLAQRAESFAGLFILLVLYGVIRTAEGSKGWSAAAVIFCGLGMLTKETVAVAPILALLYDRAFLAGSFKDAARLRWKTYAGLAATWLLILISLSTGLRGTMVGFHLGISASAYARTETNVVAHYLRQAFWPSDLTLDYYDWPIAWNWPDISWRGRMVMLAVIGWLAALRYRPWLGFLGGWFFLILAPTSSFLPIKMEAAAEQRMYLPLMAVVCLVVVGGWALAQRPRRLRAVAKGAWFCAVVVLICLTIERNDQYQSALEIWTDTVAKRPDNPRARFNLGESYAQQSLDFPRGSAEEIAAVREATEQFKMVLVLGPQDSDAVYAIAQSLERAGDLAGAEKVYTDAIARYPIITANLLVERGNLRARNQNWAGARQDFLDAIKASPSDVEPHYFLGVLYQTLGYRGDALRELTKASEIDANYKDVTARLSALSSPGSQPAPAPPH
jgi:protein O-mannosyl-transferase